MSEFQVHTKETAPTESADVLANIEKALGFVPNLFGVFAESPAAVKAYLTFGQIFDESSFSRTERQVVNLTASRLNECHYCMAAHSVFAGLQNVPAEVVEAIRNDQPIADSRLDALRTFTTAAVEKRGWLSGDDIAAFLAAGYTKAQILEVILGISFKTLSNYTNHITDTPLDDAFASAAWAPVKNRFAS